MKKIYLLLINFILLLVIISILPNGIINAKSEFEGQTLTIYNVEDYISQGNDGCVDIIGKFEEEYGVNVNYYTYDTNETMYNQFTLQKEGTYDLICTSDYMIQKLIKEELVIPMDDFNTHIPNYEKYAAKSLREKLRQMEVLYKGNTVNLDEFAVGYMWGTLGIIYDPSYTDTIEEDVKSWDVFWNTDYEYVISIKNSIRDAFVVGLMHGYSKSDEFIELMNNYLNNPTLENQSKYNEMIQDIFDFKLDGSLESSNENYEKINTVKEELISLKDNIFGFEVDSGKNDIITGKIKLNLAYSGDAVYSIYQALEEQDKVLQYYVPEDGSNIWYDAWTLPKGANKELAYAFLNFLSDPQNAADNMEYIGYTPYIVGDELLSYVGYTYGACDYCPTSKYYEESYVIFNDELFECILEKPADLIIDPTNEEYFESLEYDDSCEYVEGDMVSYNGVIYNCISDTTNSPLDLESWEEVIGYDLSYLFEGTISEGRRAIIYPYLGSENSLYTQYPSEYVISRCAIMNDFGIYNDSVVIMWGQVKAYTNMIPVYVFLAIFGTVSIAAITVYVVRKNISYKYKKRMIN